VQGQCGSGGSTGAGLGYQEIWLRLEKGGSLYMEEEGQGLELNL
jgi:hypothetical protein